MIIVILLLVPPLLAKPKPEPPFITVNLRNITLDYGQRAQLWCEAAGYPKPHVKILKKIPAKERTWDITTNAVDGPVIASKAYRVINRVTKRDEGWYYCRARNAFGIEVTRGYITVSNPCKTYRCPNGKTCQLDEYTKRPTCRCETTACKEFDVVCGSDCQTYFSPCYLKAVNCELNKNITIASRGFCPFAIPPQINNRHHDISIAVNKPLRVFCGASGTPSPTVEWFHRLDEEQPTIFSRGDELYIDSVTLAHSGIYFCQARSCGQNIAQSNTFRVFVETPPILPTCAVVGDGHVRTFSGQKYSFGGTCSYMLARECDKGSWFIYSRFGDCQTKATCLEALTIYHGTTYFEIGRGWSVNLGFEHFVMAEGEFRDYSDYSGLQFKMNGTHMYVSLPNLYIIWDGVSTAHVVLTENSKNDKTCGLCGSNIGSNSPRTRIFSDKDALQLVYQSRLDYWRQCPKSYVQAYKCSGLAKVQATNMCKKMFSCPGFSLCKLVVDLRWYMESCILDTCQNEYLRSYPSHCRAVDAFNEMCSIAGYDVSGCMLPQCDIRNVLAGYRCPANELPFRGCGPTL